MKPIVSSNASNKKVQTRISRIPDIEVAKYMLFFASQISIKYFYCGKIICDKSIFPLILSVCHVVSISSIHDDRLPHSPVLQLRDWSGQRDLTKKMFFANNEAFAVHSCCWLQTVSSWKYLWKNVLVEH